jgi:hypothetical protein
MIEEFVPMDKEQADKAAETVSEMLQSMQEQMIDPDYVAYLLLSAGFGMAIAVNRKSPIVVNQLVAAAMMVANKNILDQENGDEEEEEMDDDTRH